LPLIASAVVQHPDQVEVSQTRFASHKFFDFIGQRHSANLADPANRRDSQTPETSPTTHRGMIQLAPFFNRHGWFWGAGFSGAAVDSMHFELAEEAIRAAEGAGVGV
jgi:hypothetical protein